jgi:hypothetical protein
MASKRVSEKQMVVSPGAAQTSSARKSAAPRRATRSAPVETVATPAAHIDEPSQEAIAALAYSYWVARGCQGGSPEQDWLCAEQQLRAASSAAVTA